MPTLNKKENYLRMLSGEIPEYVPVYSYFRMPGSESPATAIVEPAIANPHRAYPGSPDVWGVNYVATYEAGNALIPEPNNFILDDITKWREVIKAPDISGIDWEQAVNADLKRTGINRDETVAALCMHFGYFQNLMSFMGFENGLTAMYEEPEAVHELMNYMSDFYTIIAEKYLDILKPEVCTLMDDTAAWGAPFISPGMFREFVMPHHKRYTDMAHERGLYTTMHNCGKCEGIIDQYVEMGITLWEPAQTCNDIAGIMEKYPIAVAGAWDARGRLLEPDITDEELRQSVRDTMDKYAKNGRFAWLGGFLAPVDDAEAARKNAVLSDEAERYGAIFYK